MSLENYILGEHDRRIAAMIQAGIIHEVNYENAKARVKIGDWISAWLPWQTSSAGKLNIWNPPSKGELCLLLSISGQPELGFIIAGFYTKTHVAAAKDDHTLAIKMPDDARINYDWNEGRLTVKGVKKIDVESSDAVTIKASNVKIEADKLEVTGNISSGGSISASKDVTASGISLKSHVHQAQGSNSTTSPPK